MAATASVKKSPYMIEWMAQTARLRKAGEKKMNDRSLLLSIHHFKKWTAGSDVLKKICCLYKSVMFQIDPLESSCSQKQ